jgi:hypothetical protein
LPDGKLLGLHTVLSPPRCPLPHGAFLTQARVLPAAFQEEWKRLPPAHNSTLSVSPATVAAITANNHRDFTQHMTQAYIHTIASGGQAPSFRCEPMRSDTRIPQLLSTLDRLCAGR